MKSIKSVDKMRLAIFGVLFTVGLAILLSVQAILASLDKLEKRASLPVQVITTPQPQFRMSPERQETINQYYEGFDMKYGDGKRHPHRQALKLLLSYLASQGECPVGTIPHSIEVDEVEEEIENKGK
jgi:hypothetical protein